MISHRLRGLVQLHVAATTAVATGYFLVIALGVRYLPWLDLNPEVKLFLYATPICVGMIVSARFWNVLGVRFHMITWTDAAAVSFRQVLVVALFIFALIVATKDRTISRLFLAFYLCSVGGLLVLMNRFFPALLARLAFHRMHRIPAICVGPPRSLGRLSAWIEQKQHLGIDVVGILCDEPLTATMPPFTTRLGAVADLPEVIERMDIGQVILLGLPRDADDALKIVEVCQVAGCRLLIFEDVFERMPMPMVPVVDQDLIFLTVHDEPLEDPLNRALKRVYDITVALPVVAILLPPLCVFVLLMQRLQSPGPLLFKRMRRGRRGREFGMLKFRSMHAKAPDEQSEASQARPGDPRIFPFGGFLRRTSLDEFPQFWNVLIGEMSIVGPRPHLPAHDSEFALLAKTYSTRQLVKPGITGLAQVSGFRGEISDPQHLRNRVKLDIHYITHWSIWLDVQITLKTFRQVFFPPKTAM